MYYIHDIRGTVKIDIFPKSELSNFSIGPFKTQEEAEQWVEKHITHVITATATDPRVKEV